MGGGVYDYGNLRAWGDNPFWKFRRQGGVKIWKPSVVWYGYFLELPNFSFSIHCQNTLKAPVIMNPHYQEHIL